MAVKFGVGFPHDQTMLDPGAVRSLAQAIEGLGFSYLTAADHVVGADLTNRPDWKLPHSLNSLYREPLMLLSFIAACTERTRARYVRGDLPSATDRSSSQTDG